MRYGSRVAPMHAGLALHRIQPAVPLRTSPIHSLLQRAGNRAVTQVLQRKCGCEGRDTPCTCPDEEIERPGPSTAIQPTLATSAPGDPSELEADRVADRSEERRVGKECVS